MNKILVHSFHDSSDNQENFMEELMKCLTLIFSLLFFTPAMAQLSLEDIGLKNEPVQQDPKIEKIMNERHEKLKTHEILGLGTWGLMTATMLTGGSALDSDLHMYLGMATGGCMLRQRISPSRHRNRTPSRTSHG